MSRISNERTYAPPPPSLTPEQTSPYSSLPSPPQTPGSRPGARKGSFSFGSPFSLLSHKGRKYGELTIAEGVEDESGARRKRLPSGGIVLIKGPFPATDYLPFSPPRDEDVPSLPPLPPNLAQLKAATMQKLSSGQHRRSLSGFRTSPPAASVALDAELPSELLMSKSLPEEGSFLDAAPLELAPLQLPLPKSGRARSGSLAPPIMPAASQMYAPRGSMGGRRPSISAASPPPRPPPPPPHLGLGALSRLKGFPRPVSKSSPNTPMNEIPDPFASASLAQALANAPKTVPKGPALRAVERADARLSLSSESPRPSADGAMNLSAAALAADCPLGRLPSMIFKETPPLRVSAKSSPEEKAALALPAKIEAERKELTTSRSAMFGTKPVLKPKINESDRPSTSPTVSQAAPLSEKEKKIRSVLGLTFPQPPTPLLAFATANAAGVPEQQKGSKKGKDLNEDSPIIVPDMPKTPPMQQGGPASPRTSPERTVKAKRSMVITRSDSWKFHKRKRSQSIAGSPTTSWTGSADTPPMPPLPSGSPQKERTERPWEAQTPLSPSLTPREYALAHAQAHNQAQAHAMRTLSNATPVNSPVGKPSSPSKRMGELEEENKLLREALKAHREKLHIALRQSTDRGSRPMTPPSANSQLQQPAHIVEGPPPVPLPPTPASPPNLLLAVPASPSRHAEHSYPGMRSIGSSGSIASMATGTSSTSSSFANSRAETPLSPTSRRETGTLFAEIANLQTQLAQAQGEIEVYKLLTTTPQGAVSPGDNLKKAMKKCRSEPMLAGIGLGIDGVGDDVADEDSDMQE